MDFRDFQVRHVGWKLRTGRGRGHLFIARFSYDHRSPGVSPPHAFGKKERLRSTRWFLQLLVVVAVEKSKSPVSPHSLTKFVALVIAQESSHHKFC